jgi:hypothetical protein
VNGGQLISEHPANRSYYRSVFSRWTVLTVLFIGLFVIVGGIKSNTPIPVLIIIGLIIGIPVTIANGIRCIYQHNKRRELTLYENGVHYRHKNGETFWTWDALQLESIKSYATVTMPLPPLFLVAHDGQRLKLDARYMQEMVLVTNLFNCLLKHRDYETTYNSGAAVKVANLEISLNGITIKSQETLAWADIYTIKNLNFSQLEIVRSSGKAETVVVHNVPDAPLVVSFLLQKVSNKTPDTSNTPTAVPQLADSLHSRLQLRGSLYSVLIATAMLFISAYVFGTGIYNLTTYSHIPMSTYIFGLMAASAPLGALWFLYTDTRKLLSREEVTITREGLCYANRSGEKFWTWEQIEGGRMMKGYNALGRIYVAYDVLVDAETVLRLHPQFERFNDVAESIQNHHFNAHFETINAKIDRGEVILFEPFALDQFGVRYKGKSYPWNELKSVEISNSSGETQLIINSQQVGAFRICISIFGITNPSLLLRLVNARLLANTLET